MSLTSEVNGKGQVSPNVLASEQMALRGQFVFTVVVRALVFIPMFKVVTGLPHFMGILLGFGVLWILVECMDSFRDGYDIVLSENPSTVNIILNTSPPLSLTNPSILRNKTNAFNIH